MKVTERSRQEMSIVVWKNENGLFLFRLIMRREILSFIKKVTYILLQV